MPQLPQVVHVFGALAQVSLRRARQGPAWPGWSLTYEVAIEATRRGWTREQSLPEKRAAMDQAGALAPRLPGLSTEHASLAGRPCEWVRCDDALEDAPVLLYFHGGAYEVGSPRSHRVLTRPLAAALGGSIAALDYRLAPEHPCPAALDDAVGAYLELVGRGISPGRIAIGGDSAGGGLTVATLVALRDAGHPLPAAAVLLSPWMDLTTTPPAAPMDFLRREGLPARAQSYAGSLPLDDPRISPIFADLKDLPPFWIGAGGEELILEHATRTAERVDDSGGQVTLHVEPGEVHVYPVFGRVNPRAREAHVRMAAFVRAHTR